MIWKRGYSSIIHLKNTYNLYARLNRNCLNRYCRNGDVIGSCIEENLSLEQALRIYNGSKTSLI